jgi:hypothetical protein
MLIVGTHTNMQTIEQDIRNWSTHVLEVPNEHLNGLPACPYAKKAWQDNKVRVIEVEDIFKDSVVHIRDVLSKQYDVIICASYNLPDPDRMREWVETMNQAYAKKDGYFMCFHPAYGAEEAELDFLYDTDWESSVEEEYCMMFMQRLTDVDQKSRHLEKLGYYQAFLPEDYEQLVLTRRHLKEHYHGNETTCNEQT